MSTKKENDVIFDFPSEKEKKFPTLVQLALVHYVCNSRCRKCPVGLLKRGEFKKEDRLEFRKTMMFPMNIFYKLADEMSLYPWSILRFHGRGEPLIHPEYTKMIKYAKDKGVGTVTSFTNAILLDEIKAEELLNAGIDLLEMSIDAYSEERYKDFRGTDFFHKVVRNAENFIRARNSRGKNCKTKIVVSAVDCPEFQSEKKSFEKFWEERADVVIFRPYHTYGGRLPSVELSVEEEIVPCAQLWTRFSINPWGKINACFNDWADNEIVGNLNDPGASIESIWRNEKFQKIREAALQRGDAVLECCKHCLATISGWNYSYQLLLEKLKKRGPNLNFK